MDLVDKNKLSAFFNENSPWRQAGIKSENIGINKSENIGINNPARQKNAGVHLR